MKIIKHNGSFDGVNVSFLFSVAAVHGFLGYIHSDTCIELYPKAHVVKTVFVPLSYSMAFHLLQRAYISLNDISVELDRNNDEIHGDFLVWAKAEQGCI